MQPGREGAVARGRLGEVRRRGRRIRTQDEADEQLLFLPEALLRVAQRDQILQTRGLRQFLHVQMVPRQETRPQGDDRIPFQQGLRDGEKPDFGIPVLKTSDALGIPYPLFAGISRF